MDNSEKTAFTLAEVLITLGIIGIVAAMTIPTLMNKTQKAEYVTGLKKAYSQFNQVLQQFTADEGCAGDLKCTGLFSSSMSAQEIGDKLVKYFKVVKNCGTTANDVCWTNDERVAYDGSSPSQNSNSLSNAYRFIDRSGFAYYINKIGNDNCENNKSLSGNGNMTQVCGGVYIDVNGPNKKPNYFGRDIFNFWITNGKGALLYPRGGSDDNWDGDDSWSTQCFGTAKGGPYCTGRIMEQGWQMNY